MFFSGIKVNKRAVLPPCPFSFHHPPTRFPPSLIYSGRKTQQKRNTWRLLGSEVRQTERHLVFPAEVLAGWAHRGVLLVIPAKNEAVLSLHLLYSVFSDLKEPITWPKTLDKDELNRPKRLWVLGKSSLFKLLGKVFKEACVRSKCDGWRRGLTGRKYRHKHLDPLLARPVCLGLITEA